MANPARRHGVRSLTHFSVCCSGRHVEIGFTDDAGEPAALEKVWRNKARLGWNEQTYGQSRVWRNTRELTMNLVPQLFRCGPDGNADCVP